MFQPTGSNVLPCIDKFGGHSVLPFSAVATSTGTVLVEELSAPQPARLGDTVQLTCRWRVVAEHDTVGQSFRQLN